MGSRCSPVCEISGSLQNVQSMCGQLSPGGGGEGDKTFTYTQQTPASSWRIQHNLDKYPAVSVVDSAGSIVIGDVEYIDKNTVIVTFQSAFAGTAYLN